MAKVWQRYGRLVVQELSHRINRQAIYTCQCDCGNSKKVYGCALVTGNTKSCGCIRSEQIAERNRTHGQRYSAEYEAWCHMKSRCTNAKTKGYEYYGGRGVIVCERWLNSFEAFLSDMGKKPSKALSLDRINPYGNYEPSNCRWATKAEQATNQRRHIEKRKDAA